MYSQGSFNPQSGQGPQAPRPPPYLQHPSTPPVLPHNFPQGPQFPPFYQHGPMGLHPAARPVPPGVMPNSGQPYLPPPPPPTVHGSAPLPHMYATAQQKLQHSSYVAPGSAPPSIPYQGSLYRAPPQQLGGVHGLHQIPPPPPLLPNDFSRSADPAAGNSQTSSIAPSVPLPVPPPPPLPPPPPASPSPLPAPPCSPPPVSSAPVSMVLPTDSLSCSKVVDGHGEYGLSLQRITALINPPPPKPKDEKTVGKIEEVCQLIMQNGPSYEDFIRQKESKNREYSFFFGGEPGSEAATAHNYFLWMKTQCQLECKADGMVNMTASTVANTTKPDASADSDMEMEDDITGSEVDQAGSHPMVDENQATGSISHRVEMSLCSSSRLGEQGSSTLVSHVEDEALGRSGFGVECPVVISQGDAEFPFYSYKDDSPKSITGVKSLHREEAAVADMMNSDKNSGKTMDGSSSPFRLLQNYASDDSSENDVDPCLEDANPKGVSQSAASKSHRDTVLNMKVNVGSSQPCKIQTGVKPSSESCQPVTAPKSEPISVASESFSGDIEIKNKNHSSSGHISSSEARVQYVSAGPSASADLSGKSENTNEDKRSSLPSNAQKIDKFGRLVREGASDSDSDDSHRTGRRHKRGRSRSWSRSISPLDRRRRRRSPRRRREKRSRSRSWSPRNRRSRSRSPSFRRTGGYKSNSIRRYRGQIPQCFDFQRGKCYRGASCQFMHHGSEKSEGSRHHKSKQQNAQLTPSSKNHKSHDGYLKPSTKSSNQDKETNHNMEDTVSATFDPENLRVVAAEVRQSKIVQEKQIDGNTGHGMVGPDQVVADSFPSKHDHELSMLTSHAEASKSALSSFKNSIEKSQIGVADPTLVNADPTARETVDTSIADSSRNQVSKISPKNLCAGDILPNADYMHDSSQLPTCLTFGPNVKDNSAPQMAQFPTDYNLITPATTNESKSASLESYPSYMLPNQSSIFSVTSAASLPQPMPPLLLPPQIPPFNLGTATMAVTSQFQQSGLLPRSNFGNQMLGTYPTVNSQVSDYQHRSYPPVSESHHSEDSRLKPLSGSNISDSRFGVTGITGQDSIKQIPVQGVSASSAFAQISQYPQPTYFLQNPPPNNVPPGEIPNSSLIHSHFQQQLPYDLHRSMHDNAYNAPWKLGAASRYPTDLQDRNQPLHLPEFGVTRSSSHFNPYASTFDRPLSSRFISNTFMPDKGPTYSNKPDDPLNSSNVLVDELGARSRHGMSAPFSRALEDNYDPLFDSIEPPSNSFKNSGHVQKTEPPGSSDIVPRLKESSLPLDKEESNKKKDFNFAASPDIEEFGETADAEVGDVENGSQSGSDALGNTGMGEVEIDQVESSGKGKKSKESRSMKLFKVCVADFVKEVLKPSWRQGNMSKEAFKTVVKKTVDKVSGAMKNRKVPKSKAKINQYIDSSQRKLTKLVMGYVDKYAKG